MDHETEPYTRHPSPVSPPPVTLPPVSRTATTLAFKTTHSVCLFFYKWNHAHIPLGVGFLPQQHICKFPLQMHAAQSLPFSLVSIIRPCQDQRITTTDEHRAAPVWGTHAEVSWAPAGMSLSEHMCGPSGYTTRMFLFCLFWRLCVKPVSHCQMVEEENLYFLKF